MFDVPLAANTVPDVEAERSELKRLMVATKVSVLAS
jgi:hypothetical protein